MATPQPGVASVRGLNDAFDKGAETALVLDSNDNVAEGPEFNVFSVCKGALYTPEVSVLPGITRRTVFDLCDTLGIEVSVGNITPEMLTRSD